MQDDQSVRQRTEQIASDIVDESRVQLMLKFRFLDRALWRMDLEPVRTSGRYPLATDTDKVYLEPTGVLARWQVSETEMVRDHLHLVMHCVFRHPYDDKHNRLDPWGVACDVMAESAAMDLCATRFECEEDPLRRELLAQLELAVGTLTPGKLYKMFCDIDNTGAQASVLGIDAMTYAQIRLLFERDDHSMWPGPAKHQDAGQQPGDAQDQAQRDDNASEQASFDDAGADQRIESGGGALPPSTSGPSGDSDADDTHYDAGEQPNRSQDDEDESPSSNAANDSQSELNNDAPLGSLENDGAVQDGDDEHDDSPADQPDFDDLAQDWLSISKQVEMDLQTFSQQWGDEAGNFVETLHTSNRPVMDYTDFLRRFSVLTEDTLVNHDEFDYIYYSRGLDIYGNIPLIEPLEYRDAHRVRDFVIALDTSESCSGKLIRKFVAHTFGILRESDAFGRRSNVHIVQCDSKVQADTLIEDLNDIDDMLENFTVRGFGGTDFRPVFDYLDRLRDQGKLDDLQGMVYFTDGLGRFPENAPDYDVAFVFMNDGTEELPHVPPWAMKIAIDEEGIENLA